MLRVTADTFLHVGLPVDQDRFRMVCQNLSLRTPGIPRPLPIAVDTRHETALACALWQQMKIRFADLGVASFGVLKIKPRATASVSVHGMRWVGQGRPRVEANQFRRIALHPFGVARECPRSERAAAVSTCARRGLCRPALTGLPGRTPQ